MAVSVLFIMADLIPSTGSGTWIDAQYIFCEFDLSFSTCPSLEIVPHFPHCHFFGDSYNSRAWETRKPAGLDALTFLSFNLLSLHWNFNTPVSFLAKLRHLSPSQGFSSGAESCVPPLTPACTGSKGSSFTRDTVLPCSNRRHSII